MKKLVIQKWRMASGKLCCLKGCNGQSLFGLLSWIKLIMWMKILLTEEKLSWNANIAISVIWWEINVQVKCAAKAFTENKCHSIYGDSFFQSSKSGGRVEKENSCKYCATNGNEITILRMNWEESKCNVQPFAEISWPPQKKYIYIYM